MNTPSLSLKSGKYIKSPSSYFSKLSILATSPAQIVWLTWGQCYKTFFFVTDDAENISNIVCPCQAFTVYSKVCELGQNLIEWSTWSAII